jgi:hypothetical protein
MCTLQYSTYKLLCRRRRSRPNADDLQNRVFVLGAVVMDFIAVMGDETAGRDRFQVRRIVVGAGAYPPGAGDDGDESVVGMRMRLAVVMRFPLVQNHIQTRFARVADQYCRLRAAGVGNPIDLLRQFDRNGPGIEIGRGCGAEASEQSKRQG